MKKTTKLIAMFTVIALLASALAAAAAEDKIFTSGVYSLPKERVEEELLQQYTEKEPEPEATPEAGTSEDEFGDEDEPQDGAPAERQVKIRSSRGDVVIENEIITLYSKLIGFDGVEVHYQWQVDRGDGNGWVDVEGATGAIHEFRATEETILYSWRLTISVDE